MPYDLEPMRAPRASGLLLKLLVQAVENPLVGPLISRSLLTSAGIGRLRDTPSDEPVPASHPLLRAPTPEVPVVPFEAWPAEPARTVAAGPAVADFQAAYLSGAGSPEVVAERLLAQVAADDRAAQPLRVFSAQSPEDVLAQARASAERHRRGAPLGPLDGVPIAVKDELDQVPYPTSDGTRFPQPPATADAAVVERLRRAGALLVGKANMHEIGIGVTGLNPHFGAARNPHDPTRAAGGSSSGSAAAVAAGYCPLAIGADGGGSIRIPAALCGVFGLKPTFGRVSERGAAPACWSVVHVGPIAGTARDLARGYMAISGPDPAEPKTLSQPDPTLFGAATGDLAGLRLGLYRPWFEDADAEVVAACSGLVAQLTAAGATIVEVELPELGVLNVAHTVMIVAEMAAANAQRLDADRARFGLDVRLNLALGRQLRADDYVQALRHRERGFAHFARAFQACDLILTPTTACTAPPLRADALPGGESDLELLDRLMRFARPANLLGLPAVSVPAGYDRAGLPIGLQAMARPWEEHLLLRFASVAEGLVPRRTPQRHVSLLASLPQKLPLAR